MTEIAKIINGHKDTVLILARITHQYARTSGVMNSAEKECVKGCARLLNK